MVGGTLLGALFGPAGAVTFGFAPWIRALCGIVIGTRLSAFWQETCFLEAETCYISAMHPFKQACSAAARKSARAASDGDSGISYEVQFVDADSVVGQNLKHEMPYNPLEKIWASVHALLPMLGRALVSPLPVQLLCKPTHNETAQEHVAGIAGNKADFTARSNMDAQHSVSSATSMTTDKSANEKAELQAALRAAEARAEQATALEKQQKELTAQLEKAWGDLEHLKVRAETDQTALLEQHQLEAEQSAAMRLQEAERVAEAAVSKAAEAEAAQQKLQRQLEEVQQQLQAQARKAEETTIAAWQKAEALQHVVDADKQRTAKLRQLLKEKPAVQRQVGALPCPALPCPALPCPALPCCPVALLPEKQQALSCFLTRLNVPIC